MLLRRHCCSIIVICGFIWISDDGWNGWGCLLGFFWGFVLSNGLGFCVFLFLVWIWVWFNCYCDVL